MRLSLKSLMYACGLVWGGALLLTGLLNLAFASYGTEFLKLASSIYPGFHASRTAGDVFLGTIYGLCDGAVGGLILGWLYNLFAPPVQAKAEK